jgi:hypothetical protein
VPRFKVLAGIHAQKEDGAIKTYKAGDIVEAPGNLLRHNKPGVQPKYGRLDAGEENPDPFVKRKDESHHDFAKRLSELAQKAEAMAKEAALGVYASMSLEELQKHVQEEEIDVGDATTREQLLEVLQSRASA